MSPIACRRLKDVARDLCVTPNTIRRWGREGKFPQGSRITGGDRGSLIFPIAEIEAALQKHQVSRRDGGESAEGEGLSSRGRSPDRPLGSAWSRTLR